ncbi:MAG: hypothetical protein ABI406_02230 [Ktedonobacteraceae bacterium]
MRSMYYARRWGNAFIQPELMDKIRQRRLWKAGVIEHWTISLLLIPPFAEIRISNIIADEIEIVKQKF